MMALLLYFVRYVHGYMKSFPFFRCDCNCFGGGLIYINEYIPSKPLNNHPVFSDLELMAFEPHQRKRKWLLLGIYKLPSQNDIEFLNRVSSIRGCYLGIYENILAMVDFKLSFDKSHLSRSLYASLRLHQETNLLSI